MWSATSQTTLLHSLTPTHLSLHTFARNRSALSPSPAQVGLLGSARELQQDLERISSRADTESPEGLHYILQGGWRALLGSAAGWVAGSPSPWCRVGGVLPVACCSWLPRVLGCVEGAGQTLIPFNGTCTLHPAETVLALMRNPDYCLYGFAKSKRERSAEDAETAFNQLSLQVG